ncbi:MAG: hypothetical protein ABIS38_03590, partial [Sphingomicrobium sp.]
MKRSAAFAIGIAATLAATALWHGPGGAGKQMAKSIDHEVRAMLDHYEMQAVGARIQHKPLTRRVMLDGPADDFQRGEIKRMSQSLPGVATAHWIGSGNQTRQLPLLGEAMLMALA